LAQGAFVCGRLARGPRGRVDGDGAVVVGVIVVVVVRVGVGVVVCFAWLGGTVGLGGEFGGLFLLFGGFLLLDVFGSLGGRGLVMVVCQLGER